MPRTLEPFLFLGTIHTIPTYDVLRLTLRVIGMYDVKIKHEINNWYSGTYEDYDFIAKVFEEPSKYGIPFNGNESSEIEGGKISKLLITQDHEWIMNYDRGWDVKPDLMTKHDCCKIIYELETTDLSLIDDADNFML